MHIYMYLALICIALLRRVSSGTPAVAEELCRGALKRAEPIPPRLGGSAVVCVDINLMSPRWASKKVLANSGMRVLDLLSVLCLSDSSRTHTLYSILFIPYGVYIECPVTSFKFSV